jgi:hypothetical protein
MKGVVHLKDAKVEAVPDSKKPFTFAIRTEKIEFVVSAETEEMYQSWMQALRESIGKESQPPPERPKNKGFVYKAQKGMAEKAATSSLGKSILKDYLPDDTWFILEAFKRIVANISGSEKAKYLEKTVIKSGVKVAWLYKSKHISASDLKEACKAPILKTWELFILCCDPKKRNIPEFCDSVKRLQACFEVFFKSHITPKSLNRMKTVTTEYFADETIATKFFTDPRHQEDLERVAQKLKILKSLFLWLGE